MGYCPNTSDYLLADAVPDGVALVEPDERHTYGQLRSAAGRLAAGLAALDLPPGSRVGLLGPNSFFWVAAYLAVMKLNHVAVPFSDKLIPDDVRRNARLVRCAAIFADRRVQRRFAGAFGDGDKGAPGPAHATRGVEASIRQLPVTKPEPAAVRVRSRGFAGHPRPRGEGGGCSPPLGRVPEQRGSEE